MGRCDKGSCRVVLMTCAKLLSRRPRAPMLAAAMRVWESRKQEKKRDRSSAAARMLIPVYPAAAQAKFRRRFHAPLAARSPSLSHRSSRFAPKARRRVAEFCLPTRPWLAPRFKAFLHWAHVPRRGAFRGLQQTTLRPSGSLRRCSLHRSHQSRCPTSRIMAGPVRRNR